MSKTIMRNLSVERMQKSCENTMHQATFMKP